MKYGRCVSWTLSSGHEHLLNNLIHLPLWRLVLLHVVVFVNISHSASLPLASLGIRLIFFVFVFYFPLAPCCLLAALINSWVNIECYCRVSLLWSLATAFNHKMWLQSRHNAAWTQLQEHRCHLRPVHVGMIETYQIVLLAWVLEWAQSLQCTHT